MSNTIRAIPGRLRNCDKSFTKDIERGHVDIPKADCFGDDVWGQGGKKHRKKMLKRAARRTNKGLIK